MSHSLGIDIGGSSVKAAFLDTQGQWQTAMSDRYSNPDRAAITAAIGSCLSKLKVIEPDCVGMCLPGRLNPDCSSIELSINVPSLNGWLFQDLIVSATGRVPHEFKVVSDADAAGFDYATDHPDPSRTAAISIGTGVGLCVLDGDKIVTIGNKGIGHLGQMDVGQYGGSDRIDTSGAHNTLESYIGAPALQAWSDGSRLDLSTLGQHTPAILALVHALKVVHAIYQPDRVVLLGGVGLALEPQIHRIKAMVDQGRTSLASPDWELSVGNSAHHAARGAAKIAASEC
jgi:predicted NBD/HSP70 family sugar kinase